MGGSGKWTTTQKKPWTSWKLLHLLPWVPRKILFLYFSILSCIVRPLQRNRTNKIHSKWHPDYLPSAAFSFFNSIFSLGHLVDPTYLSMCALFLYRSILNRERRWSLISAPSTDEGWIVSTHCFSRHRKGLQKPIKLPNVSASNSSPYRTFQTTCMLAFWVSFPKKLRMHCEVLSYKAVQY